MTLSRRLLAAALAAPWLDRAAQAQTVPSGPTRGIGAPAGLPGWAPDRPIRVIVPFPPGGSADVQARQLAERMAPALGQPLLIDNRPGGSGIPAAQEALRAPADGHTLFFGTNSVLAANVGLFPRLPYDPVRDFAPIAFVADYPQALVVSDWPAERSFAGLLAALRARAEPAAYGSSGNGSPTHLAGAAFAQATGLALTHVPYRGQAPALNDLIGGQTQLMFPSVSDVLGQLRAGRVTALAALSPRRIGLLPDVPTTAELGYPGLVSSIWGALFARAGTPDAAIARLNATAVAALETPELRGRLEAQGFELRPGPPAALAATLAEEIARLGALIRAVGVTVD